MIYIISTDSLSSKMVSTFHKNSQKEYQVISEKDVAKIKEEDTVFIEESIVSFNTPLLTHIASKKLFFFAPHFTQKDMFLIRSKKRIDTMTGMVRGRTILHNHQVTPMNKNGHIVLDVPPFLLPARRSGLWKRPERLVSSLIAHLSTTYDSHPEISLIGAEKGELLEQVKTLLGRRATVESEKSYAAGTPVLTWSTERFYHFLGLNLHPLPITKSLARSFFMPSRRKGVADMLTSDGYTQEMMDLLDGAVDDISHTVK